jgi:hypothetical protein
MNTKLPKPSKDDVEALSRGQRVERSAEVLGKKAFPEYGCRPTLNDFREHLNDSGNERSSGVEEVWAE